MSITTFFRNGSLTAIGLLLAGVLATPTFAETKKLDSVALTVGDLGNPFFVQIAHGAEAQAKQINGKVKFTALSSNYDVNNQTNQIDNFISSNVNLILLGAADSRGIAPAVLRAKQAGVKVELEAWPEMFHVWHVFAKILPEGQQAIDRIGEYILAHASPSDQHGHSSPGLLQ